MKKEMHSRLTKFLPLAVLPIILLVAFSLLNNASAKPYRTVYGNTVYGNNSVWDLRHFDFDNYNARFGGYVALVKP